MLLRFRLTFVKKLIDDRLHSELLVGYSLLKKLNTELVKMFQANYVVEIK